jgi:hypothetical protein
VRGANLRGRQRGSVGVCMGKRQRRRERQQNKARQSRPPMRRHLFPREGDPLLEVHIEPGTSRADSDTCLAYWAFNEPGTWVHKVAEIGASVQVLRTVKASCRATLLTVLCPDCSSPETVTTRSEMTATGKWKADVFPRGEVTSPRRCRECREAEARAEELERQRADEERHRQSEKRVNAARAWLGDHAAAPLPEGTPTVVDALGLLTMVDIMERTGSDSFGPLPKLPYTLNPSEGADVDLIRSLHRQRWLAPTLPATTGDFAFDDDTVRGVYISQVPWRLAHAFGENASEAREEIAAEMMRVLLVDLPQLRHLVTDLEAEIAVRYLDGLLVRKYDEEPIPEHRLPDAYATFRAALQEGFNLRQLIAVAWSATASSVAWGQRTPGLRPGSVSAAAVTNLGRRIDFAKDRKIPEYDLPNWVTPPATHATALRFLETQHRATTEALDTFRSLRQRIASRDLEALEFDGDMDDTGHHGETGDRRPDSLADESHPDPHRTPVTYALAEPDGSLTFRTGTPIEMRDKVTMQGSGFVDRIILEEPRTINAYIGELVPSASETTNPVASEMLRMLDCYDGPFNGPIAFFAVSSPRSRPRSLDTEQQELLQAAHHVALERTSTRA